MINNLSKKLILFLSFLCIIYIIIVLAFFVISFSDKDMLLKLFTKHDIYNNLPFEIPFDDVKNFVYELMDFLQGKQVFLNTKVTMNGELVDFYTNTSKIHMADCRHLFLSHKYLAKILLIPSIFGITYTIMSDKNWKKSIYDIYIKVLIFISIILLIIIGYAIIDFNSFFVTFHKIFFRNDLWLFDPTKDYIINYLPEEIFIDIGLKIFIFVVLMLLLLLFLFYFLKKTQSHQEAK